MNLLKKCLALIKNRSEELFPIVTFLALFLASALFSKYTDKSKVDGIMVVSTILLVFISIYSAFFTFKKIRGKNAVVILPILFFVTVKLFFIDSFPKWDGSEYFQAMQRGISGFDFSIKSLIQGFNWFKHVTLSYSMSSAIFQFINPKSMIAVSMFQMSMGVMGILAFFKICQTIFKGNKSKEALLLTFLFSVNPLYMGVTSAYTPDVGVLVFFLCFYASLLNKKRILTLFFATLTIFSKETGAYAMAVYVFCHFFYNVLLPFLNKNGRRSAKNNLRELLYLLAPFLLLILYFLYIKLDFWGPDGTQFYVIREGCRFCFGIKPFIVKEYLGVLLILNFNWVIWAVIFYDLAKKFISKTSLDLHQKLLFLFFTLYCLLYMVFVVYVMPRYVSLTIPISILLFGIGLRNLFNSEKLRHKLLTGLTLVFFVQSIWGVDPISKAFFGTYSIGKHDLLKIGTEYLGDAFIYNTQYLNIDKVLAKFIKDNQIGPEDNILIEPYTWGQFYPGWGHFLGTQPKIYYELDKIETFPRDLYYLSFPFRHYTKDEPFKIENSYVAPLENPDRVLDIIRSKYDILSSKPTGVNGYNIIVYKLTAKNNASQSQK